MIDFVVGLFALGYFLVISAATKQHFASEKYPLGMYVISALSLVGLFAFLVHAYWSNLSNSVATVVLISAAFLLFGWAARHSLRKNLSLAFGKEARIDKIITSGPWKFIRHPFYLSYLVFWLACMIGTQHLASVSVFIALLFIYCYSALLEERILRNGRHREDYLRYQENVGFLLPKILPKLSTVRS